jgi:hypothetical protein
LATSSKREMCQPTKSSHLASSISAFRFHRSDIKRLTQGQFWIYIKRSSSLRPKDTSNWSTIHLAFVTSCQNNMWQINKYNLMTYTIEIGTNKLMPETEKVYKHHHGQWKSIHHAYMY